MSQSNTHSSDSTDIEEEVDQSPKTESVDETPEREPSKTFNQPSPPTVFQASVEAQILQVVVSAVGQLVEECRVAVDDDGLAVRAADYSQVAMVDLWLGIQSFENFQSSDGVLGLNIERLEEILSMADPGDRVQIMLDAETNKLRVTVDGITVTMALIDPTSIRSAPTIPDVEIPATCQIEQDDLDLAISAARLVDDHIQILVDDESPELRFESHGDTDSIRYRVEPHELAAFDPATVASKFSLEYLKDVNNALPTGPVRHIQVGDTLPLALRVPIPDADGRMQFFIAPRVDD